MAKTKTPKKAPKESVPDCDGCQYLKRFYPDIPYTSIKQHCGKCRLRAEDPFPSDGLPPAKSEKVAAVPEDLPPAKLVAGWDGRVRTCWAAAGSVPAPQSVAWEHLKEWADEQRQNNPRLTVRALVTLYRSTRPEEVEEGVCRIKKLFPDEYKAEAAVWKQEVVGEPSSSESTGGGTSSSPPPTSTPSGKSGEPGTIKNDTSQSFPSKSTTPTTKPALPEGRDGWGYKMGTRAAIINAFLSDKWMTAQEIEAKTQTTSAGSHLSSLVGKGFAEYQKAAPGEKGGKFRKKVN